MLYIIFETPGYKFNNIIETRKSIMECKNTKVVKNGWEKYRWMDFLQDKIKLFLTSRHGR